MRYSSFVGLCALWATAATSAAGPPRVEIAECIAGLKSKDRATRRIAAVQLGWLGPAAAPGRDALLRATEDTDVSVVHEVFNTFVRTGPRAAEPLGTALNSKNDRVRWRALRALVRLGPDAKGAIPALVRTLEHDEDTTLRILAALALTRIGPAAREALPALVRATSDRRNHGTAWHKAHPTSVCEAAVLAIRRIDPSALKTAAEAALPTLIGMLDGDDHGEKLAAAGALGELAPYAAAAAPSLLRAGLTSSNSHGAVVRALVRIGPAGQELLLDAINDPRTESSTRDHLKHYMTEQAGLGREALRAVTVSLGSPSVEVRAWAAMVLAAQGPAARSAVPSLIEAMDIPVPSGPVTGLDFSDAQRHHPAIRALARIGASAVPALVEGLKDPARRRHAARALGLMGPRGGPAADSLRPLLRHRDDYLRADAALALLAIGDQPDAPLKALADSLAAGNKELCRYVLEGLVGPQHPLREPDEHLALPAAALEPLVHLLDVGELGYKAAMVLGWMGPTARPAVPELARRLERGSAPGRWHIISALEALGHDAVGAVPALVETLNPVEDGAWVTLRVIGSHGKTARAAVPALLRHMRDPDARNRNSAMDALGRIGEPADKIVAALRKALTDRESAGGRGYDHYCAALALAHMGPAAKAALPELRAALDHESSLARLGAATAIATISGEVEGWLPHLLGYWRDTYDPCEPYPVLPHLIEALTVLGKPTAKAIPQLLTLLEEPSDPYRDKDDERSAAFHLLGQLGPDARAAMPHLAALASRDGLLQRKAVETMRKIAGPGGEWWPHH